MLLWYSSNVKMGWGGRGTVCSFTNTLVIFFSFWNSSGVPPKFKALWQWLRIQRENKAHLGSCLHVHSSKGGNKISPSFQRTKREFFVGFCWEKKGVKFLTSMTGMAREKHTSVPGVFSPVLYRFSPDQPQGGHWCFVLCLPFTDGKKKKYEALKVSVSVVWIHITSQGRDWL